jgi:hypothetical protein
MVGQISIAVFSGIHYILNNSQGEKTYFVWLLKKCCLKLILYVLDFKNLHNETISRNNLCEISRNIKILFREHPSGYVQIDFATFPGNKCKFEIRSLEAGGNVEMLNPNPHCFKTITKATACGWKKPALPLPASTVGRGEWRVLIMENN